MAEQQPSSASGGGPPIPGKWDLSHGGGIDTDVLRILIDERNFHHEQIMAINGRLGWVILALVASVFVVGEDLRGSLDIQNNSITWFTLGLSGFCLLIAICLTTFAVIEHWRMRMVWVRRFERAIECYTHGKNIEDALAEAEKILSTRPGARDWKGMGKAHPEPVLFSALPDLRPCELTVPRYFSTNTHMRFGVAAGAFLLSAIFFTMTVLNPKSCPYCSGEVSVLADPGDEPHTIERHP